SATDDGQPMSADILKTSAPLERNQAIASQLSASLLSGISAENPASPNAVSGQAANAALNAATADDGTLFNRADQRMFATENAQQAQSQAAQQSATRTADGLPRFTMDTAFGQQGWSDSLGRQLLVMSSQGITSAQIRLDPPELGSLTVKIQMSADQQTNVSFVSQHATVREALEQQLSRLQDLFRDQGLNLQDVSVSDQSPQQREDEANGQQNQGTGSGSESGEQETSASEPVLVRSESLIDFYA
ncbi:MAG: flagellar hook-length control protein FliK, partial [Pseudohongiella sp.]